MNNLFDADKSIAIIGQEKFYLNRLSEGCQSTAMAAVILLVEDNEMNRDMLSRRLKRLGYDILMAVDGRQGSEMAKELTPDLILLDMGLPEIDGWQVAKLLKSDPDTHSIPIMALTAHAMASDRERALTAGCNEYETKPIEFQRLVEKIEKLLLESSCRQ